MHNGKKPPMMDKKGMSNVKAKDFKGTLKKLINYGYLLERDIFFYFILHYSKCPKKWQLPSRN